MRQLPIETGIELGEAVGAGAAGAQAASRSKTGSKKENFVFMVSPLKSLTFSISILFPGGKDSLERRVCVRMGRAGEKAACRCALAGAFTAIYPLLGRDAAEIVQAMPIKKASEQSRL
jgi:hypothetical protein